MNPDEFTIPVYWTSESLVAYSSGLALLLLHH